MCWQCENDQCRFASDEAPERAVYSDGPDGCYRINDPHDLPSAGCQYLLGLLERAIDWLEFSTPEEYSNARQQREFIEELRKAIVKGKRSLNHY